MRLHALKMLLLSLTIALSGCALFDTVEDYPVSAEAAVKIATHKIIDEDASRAERVLEITAAVRPMVEDSEATVSTLVALVRAEINWDSLTPEYAALADILLGRLHEELTERIGDGLLDEDDRLVASTVIDWVEEAAASR